MCSVFSSLCAERCSLINGSLIEAPVPPTRQAGEETDRTKPWLKKVKQAPMVRPP